MFSPGPDSVTLTCLVLIILKVGNEVMSYNSGVLISKFYRVLSEKNYAEFNILVMQLIAWYTGLCVLQSLSHYGISIFLTHP
jgi:hypothetical protein